MPPCPHHPPPPWLDNRPACGPLNPPHACLTNPQVGSTIVQQAGLSVMNAQKGVLPHGWLEYSDEASGRPYYYNVHTKVTTVT